MKSQPVLKVLRIIALLEALSWIALLVTMYFKYFMETTTYMNLVGRIHGFLFIGFVLLVLLVGFQLKWKKKEIVWSLLSSLPPCGTIIADFKIFRKYVE